MRIYTPITEAALKRALDEADSFDGPCAVRYPNGVEDERVIEAFYKNREPSSPSPVKNYADGDRVDAVIVTHGRIVSEAFVAKEKLAAKGIAVGIILLEVLKPYGDTAERVSAMLPKAPCKVVFLEEEIRMGGMGMILSYKLNCLKMSRPEVVFIVIAVDNSFSSPCAGQTTFEYHGLDSTSVADKVISCIKNNTEL